jgi:hypothetical protein
MNKVSQENVSAGPHYFYDPIARFTEGLNAFKLTTAGTVNPNTVCSLPHLRAQTFAYAEKKANSSQAVCVGLTVGLQLKRLYICNDTKNLNY